jgi:hypothetical protein
LEVNVAVIFWPISTSQLDRRPFNRKNYLTKGISCRTTKGSM